MSEEDHLYSPESFKNLVVINELIKILSGLDMPEDLNDQQT